MKRPQHMTMPELIALPVSTDLQHLLQNSASDSDGRGYGGAFRDEDGMVWGTLRLTSGWVRYPAYLSLLFTAAPKACLG